MNCTPNMTNRWLVARWVAAAGLGATSALFSWPAHAQAIPSVGGSGWVGATAVSVSGVVGLWLAAIGAFKLAHNMRWVSSHRHNRLTRGLQVLFGGLLLLAMLMPYLTIHHPMAAAGVCAATMLTTFVVASRRAHRRCGSN